MLLTFCTREFRTHIFVLRILCVHDFSTRAGAGPKANSENAQVQSNNAGKAPAKMEKHLSQRVWEYIFSDLKVYFFKVIFFQDEQLDRNLFF